MDSPAPLVTKYGPLSKPGAEVAVSQAGLREGLKFMRTHPEEELRLLGAKVRKLYESDSVGLDLNDHLGTKPFMGAPLRSMLERLSNTFYFVVLGMAGLSIPYWSFVRGRRPLLPLLVVGAMTAAPVIFFGDPRFHFPVIAAFSLLAGWVLAGTFELVRRIASRSQRAWQGSEARWSP